jgi:DNA-binding transcriptional MocR family regulator
VSLLPAAGEVSFARGIPSPDAFPVQRLAEASARALERHARVALNYGPAGGFMPLRAWVAERHGVAPEQVVLTPGSLLGLGLLVRHLLGRGGRAVVEAPTYDRTLRLLRATAADVVAVARGAEELDLDGLRALLAAGPRPRLLYVLPTFHNPTGRTLGRAAREALADLAAEHGLLVVEDDPYGLLRLDGEAQPHLHALLHERGAGELAVLLSSFSKTVAPGLRVGYLVLPDALVAPVEALATATYVSPPLLPQAQLYEFLAAGHLPAHLEELRAFLRPRRDALLEVLAEELTGGEATWTRPEGGYFAWLELAGGRRAAEGLAARADAAGVPVVAGAGFGDERGVRLSFSFPAPEEIRDGARRLAALVKRPSG